MQLHALWIFLQRLIFSVLKVGYKDNLRLCPEGNWGKCEVLIAFLSERERPSSRNYSTFFTFHKSAILIWEDVGCRSSGVSINQNYFMETHSLWKATECLGARIPGTSHINPSFWLNVEFLRKGGVGGQKRVISGGVPVVKLFASWKGMKWVEIKLLR